MPNDLEVDDAIVLLLGAPSDGAFEPGHIDGVTRLEKLLFLLQQETNIGQHLEDPEFYPHNFGPFSAKAYQMIPILVAADLITDSAERSETTDETWEYQELIDDVGSGKDRYSTRDLALTEMGGRYYQVLLNELPDDTEDELKRFKTQFGSLPLRQLVRYVYERYPEFTEKSLIRESVLGS